LTARRIAGEDRRELEASHREEIDCRRLETKTSLEMSALEEMSSEPLLLAAAEIARVQSQANMEHFDEFKRLCTEMEASSALALEGQAREPSLLHAVALRELRAELQSSYSSELVHVESEANKQYSNGIGSVREISGESVISHFVYSSKECRDTILVVHFKSVVSSWEREEDNWILKIFVKIQGADLWRFDKHKKRATLGMGEYAPGMTCTPFCGTQGIEVWMGKHPLPSYAAHKWSYKILLPDLV
jgi:hypothetical protein